MRNLNNQYIWITGASDGIGKELAIQLAKKGAHIILTARNVEKLNQVKDSLAGEKHLVFPMDLLKTDAIPDKVKELLQQIPTVDILINNAGISQRSLTKDTSLDVYRKIMELDYFSKVILTKTLLPHFLEKQAGQIVAISSIAGKIGTPMRSAYCSAKHAIIGFMDSLRAEVHNDNIRVLVVTPGSVKTNVSVNALEGDGKAHGVTDPAIANGLPVEECGRRIVNAMERDTEELLIAKGREKMAAKLKRFFPKMVFKMVRTTKTT